MMLSCLRKAVCHVSGKSNFASLNRKSFPICSWYDRTFIKSVTIPRSQILVRLLMLLLMSCDVCLILCLPLVGLEGDLEHSVAKRVSIERLDGDQCLIVVGHCYKSKALALVCLQVSDHLDILNCSKRSKELPEDVLLSLRSQVVDEYAPSGSIGGHARQQRVARQQVSSQGREPFLKV